MSQKILSGDSHENSDLPSTGGVPGGAVEIGSTSKMRTSSQGSLSRRRLGALTTLVAAVVAGASAVSRGEAPAEAGDVPPVPSLYSGFQSPRLPAEWSGYRKDFRLEDPPPRLR